MALKVMMSSVRSGLADVRDAAAPVITILDYECLRFETVTAQPVPPRAVCVGMVERTDIYLLFLGDQYGDPMPGTSLAPTEEEWTVARNLGKPTVVFKKEGITPERRQAEFIAKVEDYETGVWRHSFKDIPDLLAQLKLALATAAQSLQPLTPRPLTTPVDVPWRESERGIYTGAGAVLETHVVPVGTATPLPASSFSALSRTLARAGQDHGLFEDGQALEFPTTETSVTARARPDGRRPEAAVRVGRNRTISVWESLPSHIGGSILDEAQFRTRVARDLRLAASLELIGAEEAAIAVGLNPINMLGEPGGPTSMSMPFAMRGDQAMHLEATDAVPARALAVGAGDIAAEIVARVMLRLNEMR